MTTVWIIEVQAGRHWYPLLSMGFFNYKRQAREQMKKNAIVGVVLRVAKYIREEAK